MCEYAKQVMECDIRNAVKIGAMRHGDYLDVGLGKNRTMKIMAYLPPDETEMRYNYEILILGETVATAKDANIYMLAGDVADVTMTSFD